VSEGPQRRIDRDDLVRLAAIAWLAVALFGWWSVLAVQWDDDPAMIRRDYYCFYRAGELLASGEDPYSQADHAFVNPPFTLPLVLGLFHLGLRGSYVLLASLGTLAFGLGCVLASRLGEGSARRRVTVVFAMLTTPCLLLCLHLGQVSGFYFATLSSALVLLSRGHDRAAGAVAALLLAKPNLIVALLGAALVSRRWHFGLAFALMGALLVALGLPYGPEVWGDAWAALSRLAHRHDVVHADHWKQFTVYAFLRATLWTWDEGGLAARTLSVAVSVGFLVPIVRVLLALRERWSEPAAFARLASVIVLATCALNSYLFFYDASFLALPAATLALAPWRSTSLRRIAIVAAVLSWLIQVEVAFVHENPPLGGVIAAVWLAAELADLWPAQARTSTSLVTSGGV
jgi:hypothetical protein